MVKDSDQGQRQVTATASERDVCGLHGIEQSPGHGTHLIEALQDPFRLDSVDGTGGGEQPQVAVDLLGRGVGDAPVVLAISPESAVPFRQVGGDRAGRPDQLIGDGLQRSRDSGDYLMAIPAASRAVV